MRSAALIVALLVLAGALGSPATAAVEPAGEGAAQVEQQSRISGPVTTDILVTLHANGSARWSITATYALDSDVERAAFETYRSSFEGGSAPGLDADLFEALAQEASESSGRRMAIEEVEYRSSASESSGSLTLAFTWTNFLEQPEDGTLRFHDSLFLSQPGSERSWLSTLEANQTMTIRTPPGYSVNSTRAPSFEFVNNSVVIEGPQQFDGGLTITYQQTQPVTDETPWELVVGALLLAVVVFVVAVLVRRGGGEPSEPVASTPDEPPNGGTVDIGPPDVSEERAATEGDEEEVDLSLLSDEERVERLLEQNGGRMKQANIVQETGWSDAKVSQLLSSMADEGRVQKLRLGRENLISLPDEDDG
jgi:hypothetical protein